MNLYFLILYIVWSFTCVWASPCTSPLFLTPLIEANKLEQALQCSKITANFVKTSTASIPSYSGFLTVNKEYNSNLFFYFFPSMVRLN